MSLSSPLHLDGAWTLTSSALASEVPFQVPGDVHSALLAAGAIPDPYWRDTEESLDWVHEAEWTATRVFEMPAPGDSRFFLSFDSVDCITEVRLNGAPVGKTESQFLRYDFEVTEALRDGENELELRFLSNTRVAKDMAEASEIDTPYLELNCRIGHLNFLRKTQCHGGWDWNIALAPLGIYGPVRLYRAGPVRIEDMSVRQRHENRAAEVEVELFLDVSEPVETTASLRIGGQEVSVPVKAWPGKTSVTLTARIENPHLWWPVGHGNQHRYEARIVLGDEARSFHIGLRQVELLTDKDEIGHRFAFRVNGREIFMKGANWIPADALPARGTPEQTCDALISAREANMNMIRVWGGGQYEADWFYEMCDELGIMVWQDFMFACNLYPAHDRTWLDLVREEARQQVRRLSRFASIALWCGDNELVGALGWFEQSRNNRDRYLANYDRLNHALEEVVEDERPDVPFWPSSPSVGRLDFGDGWHVDTSGDMHFWDVWHSAKEFEHYRSVRPRFCSEFGFQSFPSMRLIESFTTEEDRNVSSAVMDVHQRNEGGNSRIVETIARYFKFPDGFEDMVYLSQLSQGLAMKTAIEFWRSSKPRTMGTLYWQLNDTWPVASWASLEYGGGWKTVHYMARHYYAEVMVTAQPDAETGETVLWAVNDTPAPVEIDLRLRAVNVGENSVEALETLHCTLPSDRAIEVARLAPDRLAEQSFLVFDWADPSGQHDGENHYLPLRPKAYRFGTPEIEVARGADGSVTLTSDRPALYVTFDHGGDTVYSDNCLTLLPGEPKTITVRRERQSHLPEREPELRFLIG